jgi:hypothetical protein
MRNGMRIEGADILLVIAVIVSLGLMAGWFLLTACQGGTADSSVVLVEWATESEVDTAGFNVYRSESSDGPFICINDHLIPASPDPLVGGSYVFTDTDVVAGRTYYYQLEDVEFDGTSTRHGPIEAKAAASRAFMARVLELLAIVLFVSALSAIVWRRHAVKPVNTD